MKEMKLGFFILTGLMMMSLGSYAQSNTLGDRSAVTAAEGKQKIQKQRISKRQRLLFRTPNVKHTAQYEFYERLEQVAKEKKRLLRKMAKPQYSDFSYFGHKSKPKKHLPYAMRYCKECGIRH
ncbi:MAG: hypothetical protein OJF59_001728 [Cytophagales bacterium]|jgi:hypothetical protein|nr:hypothetical protein [Bacteroidota bacterium]MBS1980649.1 hypothetical protein [Bacteroidota bacterium]WHZ07975.1 MAG: hypothetical protein OJF59_001728 [Cytophagales bacterium]